MLVNVGLGLWLLWMLPWWSPLGMLSRRSSLLRATLWTHLSLRWPRYLLLLLLLLLLLHMLLLLLHLLAHHMLGDLEPGTTIQTSHARVALLHVHVKRGWATRVDYIGLAGLTS